MIAIVPCEFCGSRNGMDLEWACVDCKKVSRSRPVEMLLHCPECGERHIDEGKYAKKAHHTHACQSCGLVWRPAIVNTVGVQFLPGFKNKAPEDEGPFAGESETNRRDRDWALAFAEAVGFDSGLQAPVTPAGLKSCLQKLLRAKGTSL